MQGLKRPHAAQSAGPLAVAFMACEALLVSSPLRMFTTTLDDGALSSGMPHLPQQPSAVLHESSAPAAFAATQQSRLGACLCRHVLGANAHLKICRHASPTV